ncbi:MAG TPA: response regulator [Anaerolineales bacterium]
MPRLLIVDDDPTMVSLLKTLLELDGFEVTPTTNPDRALESIRQIKPDLVIMDVFLSSRDGLELLRQVRASAEFGHTPVIMTSGMDVSDRAREAGADGFMLKPYSPPDLIAMIRQRLDASG